MGHTGQKLVAFSERLKESGLGAEQALALVAMLFDMIIEELHDHATESFVKDSCDCLDKKIDGECASLHKKIDSLKSEIPWIYRKEMGWWAVGLGAIMLGVFGLVTYFQPSQKESATQTVPPAIGEKKQ